MSIRSGDWIARVPAPMWLLCCGLFLSSLGLMLLLTPLGQDLERGIGLKFLFLSRGAVPAPRSVLVVPFDDRAGLAMGLPEQTGPRQTCEDLRIGALPGSHRPLPSAARLAEWPRCLHARLVDNLHAAGAATVVFDVTFRERDPYYVDSIDVRDVQDQALARAMERARNVFLATKMHDYGGHPAVDDALHAARLTPALTAQAVGVGPFHVADVEPPYGRFYLYSTLETTRPSVLVQALFFHLRSAYPALRRSLGETTATQAALPRDIDDLLVPGELEATTLQLRQMLRTGMREKRPGGPAPAAAPEPGAGRLGAALIADALARINFYGPPGSIESVRLESLMQATVPAAVAEKVAGRAVFVGYMEAERPEQVDHFESYFTRRDGVHYSGVELAATAFANLLDGTLLRPQELSTILGAVLLCGFAPLCAVLLRARALGYGLVVAFAALYLFGSIELLRRWNLWVPVVVPIAVLLPLGMGLSATWHSARRAQRARQLEAFLGRLLPREVVARIRQNAQRWNTPGTRATGACLATDVEAYSKLSERLAADELARLMDRYFSMLTREIARHDGVVSNIAGDEIIGVWADERAEEVNCRQACEASLAIHEAVEKFNRLHPRTPLPTRQGVHYGPLSFGSLEGQAPLGAFGDTVNTASRIQNLNKTLRTRILVSLPAAALPEGFLARDLGQFLLRNKSIPTRVHELLGRNNTADPSQRRLCAQFAVALSACRAERMTEALGLFRDLLVEFPDDGPTAYYMQYIAEHPEWNGQAIAIN